MPKPANALPASLMISRSESLPITIETIGLEVIFLLSRFSFRKFYDGFLDLLLQSPRGDVFAVVHSVEMNLLYRGICPLDGHGQISRARGHAQHAAASGVEISALVAAGAGVKNFHPFNFCGFAEAGN